MYWFLLRITKAKRRITPLDQVLIALQFHVTETFQTVVGNVLKYSQATVFRSIHDVSRALTGYHSINVQVCIDRTFIYVLYRAYGFYLICVHDSTIFKTSALGLQCVQGEFCEGFLLGDSGYGCTPYLIMPFSIPSNNEEIFGSPSGNSKLIALSI
ncbi:hypothetical protein GHT06_022533 [Daphnia sinensis]|uniref:DDE Tnp4 domain-containing protein n=1 Tax=Daphnia sinensis TaxID=1820382 RepID=A0AAD5PLS4_9CRUS|nr:hypothetical protein GHT06_022533 [Daphnia sinensis]